jgi:hypothetical protein
MLISRLCPLKGLTIFWIRLTWRTGDGGTALVLLFLHQTVLANWLDERADSKEKTVNVIFVTIYKIQM